MTLPDDWICPSRERCLCGSICEAREAMDISDELVFFPGEASSSTDPWPEIESEP